MSNEITAPKTASGTIAKWLDNEQVNKQIVGALAGYMDADTFKAQCALAARDPNLAGCDSGSLFAAFLLCAQAGLLPGKHHGHVWLIPRKGTVDVMPGANGYLYLFRRQPDVQDVKVMLVHEQDEFEYHPDSDSVTHRFDPFSEARVFHYPTKDNPKGGLRGGYVRVDFKDGRTVYHFVPVAKVLRNMACAQSTNIWQRWFEEMVRKTIIRDAWARRIVPIDPELAERLGTAEDTDRHVLGEDPSRVIETTVLHLPNVEAPVSGTAKLKARMAAQTETAQETTEVVTTTTDAAKTANVDSRACGVCGSAGWDDGMDVRNGCPDCFGGKA
jgi:phage RecT family recombinase